jgi:type I restriction enzyme S subunit
MKTDWVHKKLGELGYSYSGLSGKTIDDFGEGKPFIPYMNIFSNGEIDPDKLEYVRIADNEHQNKVEQGDWFFTTSSETPEEVGMTSVLVDNIGEAYLNSFCFGFRLYNKQEFDPKFASYLFRSEELRKKISLFAQGSTRYNLPKQQMFEKLFISYPASLSAQRHIAAILASADKVIAATQKTIAKYKQIKQGMMEELFNEQCTMNNVQWRKVKLGECLKQKPDYGINAPAVPYDNNLPTYLRITDITEDGYYSKKDIVSVSSLDVLKYVMEEGDLVFARTGASTGKTYLYNPQDGMLVFAGFLIRVRTDENKLLPEFFKYQTQTPQYKNWIAANSMRTGQPGINGNEYEEFSVPIPFKNDKPDLAEQRRIATILSGIDAKIAAEEKVLEKYEKVKKGLMERLLNEQ